jgi:four helix bundle protein
MKMEMLRNRTKQFALRIVRMFAVLPKNSAAKVIGHQVLRSGTSVAANLREATRARSKSEFLSKLGIVEQELDETILWLELLVEAQIVPANRMAALCTEADELLRIIVASIRTAKKRSK